jgi:hypothetical protein
LTALFGAMVALLVAWRRDILFDPPYFEYATGLFMEADFLAESNYDYHRLRYDEKYVAEGGPYAYMTSVLPTLIAWLMRSTSEPGRVFLYYHLFNIACAALTLVSLYALLIGRVGRLLAGLCALALVTNPIFSTQVDMLGMDLPMTAFCVLSAALLINGWRLTASLASLIAFLMKPTGALATMVIIAYLMLALVVLVWQRRRRTDLAAVSLRPASIALAVAVVVFLIELAISRWGGINEKLLGIIPPDSSFFDVWLVCPDLVLLGLVTLVGSLPLLWKALRTGAFAGGLGTSAAASTNGVQRAIALIVCWLMLGATTLAIIRYGYVSPRYFTLWAPYLFAVLGLVLASIPARNGWAAGAIAAIVGFNLVNWDGKFLPHPDDVTTWTRTENRCRGYLSDMRSTVAAMHEIEKKGVHEPILAGHPFPYFLALPRMGYVRRPMRGYSINAFENERFPNWAKVFVDRPESIVVIWEKNYYYHYGMARIPPPEPGDEVIFRSDDPSPLVVYRKRFPSSTWSSGEADRWILEHCWYDPDDLGKVVPRADLLAAFGRPDLAIQLLEMTIRSGGESFQLRLKRSQLLARAGRRDEAQRELDALLTEQPRNTDALLERGALAEAAGDLEAAKRCYRAAIEADQESASPYFRLALLLLRDSDLAGATRELRTCVRLDPKLPVYRTALGVALAQQGELDEARQEFLEALRLAPGDAAATDNLRKLENLRAH